MRWTDVQLAEAEQRYRSSVTDIRDVQARVLASILERARGTAFSRDRRLTGTTVEALRDRVPIQTYEDHAPYIARLMAGEPDQLFAGGATGFLETSGTTAGPKHFPVRELSAEEQTVMRIDDDFETALFLREHPDLSYRGHYLREDCGQWFNLVGAPAATDERGRRVGFISGFTYERLYRSAPQLLFTRPSWLPHLSGVRKLYVLARLAVGADIRVVSGLPDAVGELARMLEANAARFIRDVRDGTLSEPIAPALAAELPELAPDPARAEALEACVARDGALWPRHLWPRLGMLRTYCQSAMHLYGDFFRKAYCAVVRDMGIHSTEGHALAFCLRSNDPTLALALHRNFYELVDGDGRVHLAHEVSVGETYRLALTTRHGLFRYDSRDMLRVTGRAFGVPTFELVGRAGASSLVGEKLTEMHVTSALGAALSALGARVVGFVVVPHPPIGEQRGFYELAIECEPPQPDPRELAERFEEELGRANVWYREYRLKTGALDSSLVTFVPRGWFSALRDQMLVERGDQAKNPIFWAKPRPPEWPPVTR
jgi:hypothetical protein